MSRPAPYSVLIKVDKIDTGSGPHPSVTLLIETGPGHHLEDLGSAGSFTVMAEDQILLTPPAPE